MVTTSIVSHGHGQMVARLVDDLFACPEVLRIEITQNVSEEVAYSSDPRLDVRGNAAQRGYGANHNTALLMQPRLSFVFSIRIFDFREILFLPCYGLSTTNLSR